MKLLNCKRALLISALYALSLGVSVQAAENTAVTTTTQETHQGTSVSDPSSKVITTKTTQALDNGNVVETTRRVTVSTPVPAPKDVNETPTGYVNCFTVEGNWYKDLWVPSHRVCQYENSGEGAAWVEGYWGCNKATSEGVCSNWEWKPAHWEKSLAVY